MHQATKEWDHENGFVPKRGIVPPKDRPCDWCGEPMKGERGYIHEKCIWKEVEALSDYGF